MTHDSRPPPSYGRRGFGSLETRFLVDGDGDALPPQLSEVGSPAKAFSIRRRIRGID